MKNKNLNRWQQRFQDYNKSFNKLTEAISRKNEILQDELLMAGLIQTYEFTLELAWKTLKNYLEDQGFKEINSPKKVLRTAFQEDYINNGELWIEAIDARNITSHVYNEDIAKNITLSVFNKYYALLDQLNNFLHNEFNTK